jgi:DNA-binding MarR family transcriptional regulator
MPSVDDLLEKSKKKFKRSSYRPWNYMDEIAQEEQKKEADIEIKKESIENQLVIKSSRKDALLQHKDQAPISIPQDPTSNVLNSSLENQTESDLDRVFRLGGHQKTLFMFIVERVLSRGLLNTGVIKVEVLAEMMGTTSKMVKTTISRLVKKGLISREKGKRGRGGFYVFCLTGTIRNAALEYKRLVLNDERLDIKKESIGNQLGINKPQLIYTVTSALNLPTDWQNINIAPLADIGFTEKHLSDIYDAKSTTAEVVQESINHFAYGLEHNAAKYKTYSDPLNVFIGCLRKGKPWFESSYISPLELATKALLDQRKAEKDRLLALETEMLDMEFSDWMAALTTEQKRIILPAKVIGPEEAHLKAHFMNKIWPDLRAKLLLQG